MKIWSNGSKWAGQSPDSVATLLEMLGTETLDPWFEAYGNFVIGADPAIPAGQVRVWGNFLTVSHMFRIDGTPEEMAPLVAAIRANQATAAYRAARQEASPMPTPQYKIVRLRVTDADVVAAQGGTGGRPIRLWVEMPVEYDAEAVTADDIANDPALTVVPGPVADHG